MGMGKTRSDKSRREREREEKKKGERKKEEDMNSLHIRLHVLTIMSEISQTHIQYRATLSHSIDAYIIAQFALQFCASFFKLREDTIFFNLTQAAEKWSRVSKQHRRYKS